MSKHNLEEEFSDEEILDGLRSCNGDKARGSDEFNMKFLQEFWPILKDDLVMVFKELHHFGNFVKSLNSTFIVLISKVERANNNIRQFRLISLVSYIYKLISKVLARRLSRVLGEVIVDSQHAFMECRQSLDAALVASEIVYEMVGRGVEGVLCKLDIEKTYDHACWEFVDYMLGKLGFGGKWRGWMRACVTTASFVVMINGDPSFFRASRALRQDDP